MNSFFPASYGFNFFFPNRSSIDTAIWMHLVDANKTYGGKNLTAITQECREQY